MALVTAGMQEVLGGELAEPERALVLGPCKAIDAELEGISCRSIDLEPPGSEKNGVDSESRKYVRWRPKRKPRFSVKRVFTAHVSWAKKS